MIPAAMYSSPGYMVIVIHMRLFNTPSSESQGKVVSGCTSISGFDPTVPIIDSMSAIMSFG